MLWNAKNGEVVLGDTEMSYASFGRGERVLILLPGLSDGLATVRGKALVLAWPYRRFLNRYTIYMFSRKNRMPEGYSIRDMADDQARAMEALGIRRAAVMGVSQGGMIAQYLAIDHAEMVDKLVLAVSAPYANDTVRGCVSRWMDLAGSGQFKALFIDIQERSYSEAYLRKYRALYPVMGAVMKRLPLDRFFINARAILAFNALDLLRQISCPVLLIGGTDDGIVGANAIREMKERLANSELHVYEGLGHGAYEEAADFNDRVFAFLEAEPSRG